MRAHTKVGISVKDLNRRNCRGVVDVPVENRGIRDHAETFGADPLPVHDVLSHHIGLQLLSLAQVEDLQCSRLRLEGYDLTGPVHDGAISLDGTLYYFIVVSKVDDDNVRIGRIRGVILSNADIVV